MFIFIRLIAAHLIADFLLQTDRVFQIKVKYKWGVLLHGSIVGVVTALALLPYFQYPLIVVLFLIGFVLHIFQDKAKILYNFQIERNNLWTFLLDQLLHFLVLAVISFGTMNLDIPSYPGPEILNRLYSDTGLFLFIIWLSVITYSSSIMQEYIKKAITGEHTEKIQWPKASQKYLEMLLRTTVAIFIFLGSFWNIGAVVVALIGFFIVRARKMPALNFQIGTILAVVVGVLMKLTIN